MRSVASSLRRIAVFAVPGAALLMTACPVDDRQLQLDELESDGGTGSGSSGRAGKGNHSQDGGMGGEFSGGGEGGDSAGGEGGAGADGAGASAGTGGSAGTSGAGGSNGGSAGAAGSAGTSGAGGSNGGSAGTSGAGGSNGGAGGNVGGCAEDLNGNSVADCEETLLVNASFDVDASSWSSESVSTKVWDSTNATATSGSGSIAVTNSLFDANVSGRTGQGATQCVPVQAGTTYLLQGHVFIGTGQTDVMAQIGAFYYASENCTGDIVLPPYNNAPFTEATGAWSYLQSSLTPPEGAQSVLLRLLVIKPFNQTSATVKFDNLLFMIP